MFKLILIAFCFLCSIKLSGQATIRNPRICNDQSGRFRNYFDGTFDIQYKEGKFETLKTYDSTIQFFELNHKLLIIKKGSIDSVSIITDRKGINFIFKDKMVIIKDSAAKDFNIAGMNFFVKASNWTFSAKTIIDNYTLELKLNKFNKTWKWDEVYITKGSISLLTNYNCFYYAGPQSHIIQDIESKYGITLSNSFKNHKYIWQIKPAYYEDHKITLLSDFGFNYSKKGVFKKSKSFGAVQSCNFEYITYPPVRQN